MGHAITLEILEVIYAPLAKRAEQSGRTLEELALVQLMAAGNATLKDPVEKFIGAFKSNVPD